MRLLRLLVLAWLVIAAIAAGQRGYSAHASQNCVGVATIAVTVIVGPLNYAGINPKVTDCNMPRPST